MAEIYDGKVYGIFDPLKVSQEPEAIVVRGGTFVLTVQPPERADRLSRGRRDGVHRAGKLHAESVHRRLSAG